MLRARGYGAEWYCLILEIENTLLRATEMHCLNFGGIFSDEVFAEVNVNHAALWRHGFSKGSVNTKLMSDDEDMLLHLSMSSPIVDVITSLAVIVTSPVADEGQALSVRCTFFNTHCGKRTSSLDRPCSGICQGTLFLLQALHVPYAHSFESGLQTTCFTNSSISDEDIKCNPRSLSAMN